MVDVDRANSAGYHKARSRDVVRGRKAVITGLSLVTTRARIVVVNDIVTNGADAS